MNECVFCRIVSGQIPSQTVYANDAAVAFRDIQPKAPVHVLVVPRRHVASLHELDQTDTATWMGILEAIRQVVGQTGLGDRGYKVIVNAGQEGGQVVPHLHLHILGGKNLAGVAPV